ncbi:MAG: cob(I)yrinic acid a,c-diamide adenosyltransferase [Chloroflexaceae bacterium]|nr:cob(I)yrinic acid a,c-diamide adenosyltransferase [Chloroflexaceae bacterium]
MKIYTRTGDAGETGLWGGQRVAKDSLRVHSYGTIDELNAVLGIVRTQDLHQELDTVIERIQNELFVLGADLATPGESTRIERIQEHQVQALEQEIDQFETELQPLRQFILPGGSSSAAYLHLARNVCRRAERMVVSLSTHDPINEQVLPYLNRLSDWLFVIARLANARSGVADVPWQSPVQP